MNLNKLIKYIIWIVVFGIAIVAIYMLFKKFGMQ